MPLGTAIKNRRTHRARASEPKVRRASFKVGFFPGLPSIAFRMLEVSSSGTGLAIGLFSGESNLALTLLPAALTAPEPRGPGRRHIAGA